MIVLFIVVVFWEVQTRGRAVPTIAKSLRKVGVLESRCSLQVANAIRQQTAITARYRPTECTPKFFDSHVAMVGTKQRRRWLASCVTDAGTGGNARSRRTARAGRRRSGRKAMPIRAKPGHKNTMVAAVLLTDQTAVQQEQNSTANTTSAQGREHQHATTVESGRHTGGKAMWREHADGIISMSRYSWLVKPRSPPPSRLILVPHASDQVASVIEQRVGAARNVACSTCFRTCGTPRSAGLDDFSSAPGPCGRSGSPP